MSFQFTIQFSLRLKHIHLMKGKAGEAAREWRGAEVLSCTTCIAEIDFRRSVVVVRPLSFCFDHT